MNWPPMLMHIKVKNKETDFGVWIPFILLLIIAFAVVIALLIVGLEKYARLTLWGIITAFVAAWSLKGLEVNVQNAHDHVIVSVI